MSQPPRIVDFHGLPAVQVIAPDGAVAVVTLYGAQVVSWIPAGAEDRIYLSERSRLAPGQAIRGGVPVIFPQFGPNGLLPRHGFARLREWTACELRAGRDFALATLQLDADAQSLDLWPHRFRAEITVAVSFNRLDVELEVENPDDRDFAFTAALHTYLRVAEVEAARLQGLSGTRYLDQAGGGEAVDGRDALVVDDELDRVYLDAPSPLWLRDGQRLTGIHAQGFPDVVVWNPWDEKSRLISDLPPLGFRRFLCVEAALVGRAVTLEPGEAWWGRQSLIALR